MNTMTLLLAGGVALMVPLLFAAMGELISELAGAINISLEAMMLVGAFSGYLAAAFTGSLLMGFLGSALGGVMIAGLQVIVALVCEANQIVTGVVLNILALGISTFGLSLAMAGGLPRTVPTLPNLKVPLLKDIPIVGEAVFQQNLLVYIALATVPTCWYVLRHMRIGLTLRAVGERAASADALGVSVLKVRSCAVLVCGVLAGIGGGQLVLGALGAFAANLTAGRGFIALAAVVFGGWRVFGTFIAVVLFGLADALQLRAQALGIDLPYQFLVMAPYVLTIVVLVGLGKRSRPPLELGLHYIKD